MTTDAARPYGPSALGGSPKRFFELTMTLARTEFKLRYFGSALGYLWSLIRPLLFFGVIYVVFTKIFDVGKGVPHYGVYLLTGIVLWTYFGEATGTAVTCLVAREPLLRKIQFPRMAVPLAASLTSCFNLAMNSIAVIVFALANGVTPTLSWLWMLPIVLGFIVIATGVGMLLSALYVRFRDVQPIWEVVTQILFYASPIMYPASHYKSLEHYAMLSPFATMLTQMGYAFIHPGTVYVNSATLAICHSAATAGCVATEPMRSAVAASGGVVSVVIAVALIPAAFALGWWFFKREAPRVAENL